MRNFDQKLWGFKLEKDPIFRICAICADLRVKSDKYCTVNLFAIQREGLIKLHYNAGFLDLISIALNKFEDLIQITRDSKYWFNSTWDKLKNKNKRNLQQNLFSFFYTVFEHIWRPFAWKLLHNKKKNFKTLMYPPS